MEHFNCGPGWSMCWRVFYEIFQLTFRPFWWFPFIPLFDFCKNCLFTNWLHLTWWIERVLFFEIILSGGADRLRPVWRGRRCIWACQSIGLTLFSFSRTVVRALAWQIWAHCLRESFWESIRGLAPPCFHFQSVRLLLDRIGSAPPERNRGSLQPEPITHRVSKIGSAPPHWESLLVPVENIPHTSVPTGSERMVTR